MASFQEKLLGQVRENSTNAASIYSPAVGVSTVIKSVVICNQSGSPVTYRIFLDHDGTTYDANTALYYDEALAADTAHNLRTFWVMNDASGNLAYRSSVANAITITAFGAEIS